MRRGSDARLLEPRSDAEDAITLPSRFALTVLLLCLCGPAGARMSAQVNGGVPPKAIRVTLLGTASGPRVHAGMAGISTLVEAGGERFLIDAGWFGGTPTP